MLDWNKVTTLAEKRLQAHRDFPSASKRDFVHDALFYILARNLDADSLTETQLVGLVAWKALNRLRDAHRRNKRFEQYRAERRNGARRS